MRRTGCVLFVLFALESLGCARSDWISETLTLVNVTGAWAGTVTFKGYPCASVSGCERSVQLMLQQSGARVTGKVAASSTYFGGDKVERTGELFSFQFGTLHGEVSVSGDEMDGRAEGGSVYTCPCTVALRRAGPADTMRQER